MGPENSDAETLDLNDATIWPARVDSHVHLSMSGTMDQAERLRQLETTGFDRAEGALQKHLDQHLAVGLPNSLRKVEGVYIKGKLAG